MADDERTLLDRAARWPKHPHWSTLTEGVLRDIAQYQGIDFATALLYDRIVRSPEHGPMIEAMQTLPEQPPADFRLDANLVVVPGAFRVEFPHTGADGRLVREIAEGFGCRTELVPLPSLGSLAQDAHILCDWLAARPEEPIILASLSKGGSDVKTALALPDAADAFRNVVVWLNLSGMLQGTPLVPWLFASRVRTAWFRFLFWMRRYDFAVIPELARGPATPLAGRLRLPGNMRVIHVIGFPLLRHLSTPLARRCHRRIRECGPNDGAGIVLADTCRWPGWVYPVWAADHYLRPGGTDLTRLARRLLQYVGRELLAPAATSALSGDHA
jgi:hypothetical protein